MVLVKKYTAHGLWGYARDFYKYVSCTSFPCRMYANT